MRALGGLPVSLVVGMWMPASATPRTWLVGVPDSGHGMPEEAPDAIISAVREIVTIVRGERP
jgi:pimeloyl-ACP methyl ester carboxylesterase